MRAVKGRPLVHERLRNSNCDTSVSAWNRRQLRNGDGGLRPRGDGVKRLRIVGADSKLVGGVRADQVKEIKEPAGGSIQISRSVGKRSIWCEAVCSVPASAKV